MSDRIFNFQFSNKKEDLILQIAASIEKLSLHPLALAIVKKAEEAKLGFLEVADFETIEGKGLSGKIKIDGKEVEVLLGNKRLIAENNIAIGEIEKNKIESLENQGKTVVLLGLNQKLAGIMAIADTLKENSKQAVALLQKAGKKVAMITGDNQKSANAIAKELGIDYVLAEVLPQDKANEIKKLQADGKVVAMVGDGINDAPALAQADLGIALGSGTDIAMETGDIVLVKDNLLDVVLAISLSKYTFSKIKQNLFWAFGYNVLGIPIAAGVLYSSTGFLLSPAIAALAMAFSSVSVVLNSLSMKRKKF
ncbi:MAG: HAD-IC family P-type ATPase [bacterium]